MSDDTEKECPVNHGSIYGSINSRTSVTVDDILNFIGFGPLQIIAFCLAGLTSLAFGLEILTFAFIEIPLHHKWNITGVEFAILPSLTGVSNIFGGFLYGYLCDHFGRVWPYALAVANVGLFSLASAFSPSFVILVLLRCITSIGVPGAAITIFPTLIEFLPGKNRGKVLILVLLVQALGNCICGGLAWWLIPTYEENGWRYLLIAVSIPSIVAALFRVMFYIESPRFLMAKGRYQEARRVFSIMARINRKNLNDFIPIGSRLDEIVALKVEMKEKQSYLETARKVLSMFRSPYLRRTVCFSIIYVTETAGLFGSSIFLPKVLQNMGFKNLYEIAFVGFLGQIPGILLMSIIVEWKGVGRINSLRFFTAMTIVSFLLFAFVQNPIAIPVFTVLIYFSAQPMIPLLFTYMTESYPTNIRGLALGCFNNLSAAFSIFIPYLGGYLSDDVSMPWLYPTTWAGLFLVQFFAALFLRHETLGINLTDTVQ